MWLWLKLLYFLDFEFIYNYVWFWEFRKNIIGDVEMLGVCRYDGVILGVAIIKKGNIKLR